MNTLADRLLPDALWQRIQPLLPPPPSHARGGAPRTVPDRACMAAILFMARTSTPPHPGSLPRSPRRIAALAIAMPNDSGYMHAVHVLDDPSDLPQRARWYLSQWGSRFRTPLSAATVRGAVSVMADLGVPDPGPVPEQMLAQMIAFEQRYGGLAARLPPYGDVAEFGLDATGNLEAWRDTAGGWVVDCGCDHRGVVWVLDEDGLVQTRGAIGLQGDRGTMPAHLELLALQVYVMNPKWTRVWVDEPPDDTVLDRLGSWPDAPAAVLERLGSLPPASAIELPGGTTWWADEQVAAYWYPLRERAVLYGHGAAGVRRIEQAIKGAGS